MTRLYHRILMAALVLGTGFALVSPAHADEAGAISLTIPPNVRGEGMGGLFLSSSDNYAARWSNPATLGFMNQKVAGLMMSQLVPDLASDVYFFYGGGVIPTESVTFDVDVTYLSYGESEAVDSNNVSQGTFESYEFSLASGLGFKFLPNLALGVAAKFVRIDLAPETVLLDPSGSGSGSGSSWAFDLGAEYRQGPVRFGAVVSNLGPDITFIDAEQSDPMPRNLRIGGMYDLYENEVGLARFGVEVRRSLVTFSRSPEYHAGGEFIYAGSFAFRAGYTTDKDGDVSDATFGMGFNLRNLTLDYANVPQASELDRVHRFAIWFRN